MAAQNTNEVVTVVAMPQAGFFKALTLDDRTTSLRYNLVEVTAGPVFFLTVPLDGTAPTLITQMHALPVGAVEKADATGTVIGDLYVHAPAGAGTLKLVRTS